MADATCALKLLVDAHLAKAIIGTGGSAVRRLKIASGVHSIHLSTFIPGGVDRTCTITGPSDTVKTAARLIAELLRGEDWNYNEMDTEIKVILPNGELLVGAAATAKLEQASGATMHVGAPPAEHAGSASEALLTCRGTASQVDAAIHFLIGSISKRHQQRHADFFRQWSFATDYNDHFETPRIAYTHIAPILHAIGEAKDKEAMRLSNQNGSGSSAASASSSSMRVYDPYYCKGSMVECLTSAIAGLTSSSSNQSASSASATPTAGGGGRMPPQHRHHQRDRPSSSSSRHFDILNANRDFYADVTSNNVPQHEALVTNPPYSGNHKERLLSYLLSEWRKNAARNTASHEATASAAAAHHHPFLLLLPSWVADTEYWRAFLSDADGLCDGAAPKRPKKKKSGRTSLSANGKSRRGHHLTAEVRCGVFYISPTSRYSFVHPEATGHSESPFHAIWVCGGWVHDRARRKANCR